MKIFKIRTAHFVYSLRIFVSACVIITLRYYKVVSSSFNFTLDFGFDFGLGVKYLNVFLGKYLATLIWGNLHKNFMKMWVTQLCYANVTKVCHASQGNLSAVDHTNVYDKMGWNRKAILHVLQIFITISVSQLQFYLVTKPEQVNLSWGLFKTNS